MDKAKQDTEEEDIASPRISLPPPVVPIPSAKNLDVLKDQPVEDNWVELVFRDEEGKVEKIVKSSLVRSGRI